MELSTCGRVKFRFRPPEMGRLTAQSHKRRSSVARHIAAQEAPVVPRSARLVGLRAIILRGTIMFTIFIANDPALTGATLNQVTQLLPRRAVVSA